MQKENMAWAEEHRHFITALLQNIVWAVEVTTEIVVRATYIALLVIFYIVYTDQTNMSLHETVHVIDRALFWVVVFSFSILSSICTGAGKAISKAANRS